MDPTLKLKFFGAAGALGAAIAGIFLAADAAEGVLGKRFVRGAVYAIPIIAVLGLVLILGIQAGIHSWAFWVSLMLVVAAVVVDICFYARRPPDTKPNDIRWAWVLLVAGFSLSLVQAVGDFAWSLLTAHG